MQEISLSIFINQWIKQGRLETDMSSRLANNTLKFAKQAGILSKRFFRRSFSYGGFYGGGMKWRPRESKWGRKFTHPTLLDKYNLRDGIKGEVSRASESQFSKTRTRLNNKRLAVYNIWTSEESYIDRKRRSPKGKGLYNHYAAIHNTDPDKHQYTVNQYPKGQRKPVQRKFIGYSKSLDMEIAKLYPMIFEGFPNA